MYLINTIVRQIACVIDFVTRTAKCWNTQQEYRNESTHAILIKIFDLT